MGFADYEHLKKNLILSSKIIQTEIPKIDRAIESKKEDLDVLKKNLKRMEGEKKITESKLKNIEKEIELVQEDIDNLDNNLKIRELEQKKTIIEKEIINIKQENKNILNVGIEDERWLNKKINQTHNDNFDDMIFVLTGVIMGLIWVVTLVGLLSNAWIYGDDSEEYTRIEPIAQVFCFTFPFIGFGFALASPFISRKLRTLYAKKKHEKYKLKFAMAKPIMKLKSIKQDEINRLFNEIKSIKNIPNIYSSLKSKMKNCENKLHEINMSINSKELELKKLKAELKTLIDGKKSKNEKKEQLYSEIKHLLPFSELI